MKVSLIGAGRAADFVVQRLTTQGLPVHEIYNRNANSRALRLAEISGAKFISRLEEMDTAVDAVLFAIHDDAIAQVAEKLSFSEETLRISMSGSFRTSELEDGYRWSVFWPVYSLQMGLQYSSSIPIVHSSCPDESLKTKSHILAAKISDQLYVLEEGQRMYAHLSAVVANNFVNFLNKEVFSLLREKDISPLLIQPIMKETLQNSLVWKYDADLTGPAVRNDQATINLHEHLLSETPELLQVYRSMNEAIQIQSKK